MKKYIGIDIGGMTIKGIIIDRKGEVYCQGNIVTGWQNGGEGMCRNIRELTEDMMKRGNISREEISGVGVGCPGMIDSKNGVVVFAGNLNLHNFPLAETLEKYLGFKVKITNDANAAALGEAKFGAGKDYRDSILITLGTGVGGGIIIDGKLFEGFKSAGAEMGHMVIVEGGEGCTCGRQGCFEAYSSATALMKKTREVMQNNPESAMWRGYNLETVSGKTPFDYPEDKAANEIIDWYVKYLACGICNLANIFRPQVVMLGGGVSEQGERLTKPLQTRVDAQIFGGTKFAPVKVVKATLGSRAGAFGAATLAFSLRSQTASKN